MAKSANLYARIEPDLKSEAEGILNGLGVPVSNAINIFYRQIVLHRGLPFEVQMPRVRPKDMAAMSQDELDAELAKGFDDIGAGRVRSFSDVRHAFACEYGI